VIEGLALEVKRFVSMDSVDLANDETIIALHRLHAQLEAGLAKATAAWEAKRGHANEHRTAAAWLRVKCHLAGGDATRILKLGRACRVLPVAEEAWLAGDITGRHVALIDSKRNERTADAMERDESMLVDHARRLMFSSFQRSMAYWEQRADPDGVEVDAQRLYDERHLHLSQTWKSSWRTDGVLDPIGGSIVEGVLRKIEQELFEHDWAEAKARLGDAVTVADLSRTGAQRRADALVEMATRAATAPADGRRPEPLFTVLVGYETLEGRICELANGSVVTPGSLVPWLTEAIIERAVFTSPTRVEVSKKARLFTGATRRGMEIRDRTCTDCDVPADQCQGDHTVPYGVGGETTQENGEMRCGFHNRLRNRRPQGP
jgi:hypothetical protein